MTVWLIGLGIILLGWLLTDLGWNCQKKGLGTWKEFFRWVVRKDF